MATIPQINSANNPESPERCVYCAELFNIETVPGPRDRPHGNPWTDLLERVLQSWQATLRAGLLLAIAFAGMMAIIVAVGVAEPHTMLELPWYVIRRGRA